MVIDITTAADMFIEGPIVTTSGAPDTATSSSFSRVSFLCLRPDSGGFSSDVLRTLFDR